MNLTENEIGQMNEEIAGAVAIDPTFPSRFITAMENGLINGMWYASTQEDETFAGCFYGYLGLCTDYANNEELCNWARTKQLEIAAHFGSGYYSPVALLISDVIIGMTPHTSEALDLLRILLIPFLSTDL